MEHWIEINLLAERNKQDRVLLEVLRPYVEKLKKKRILVTWHFFREPEIRFRVRLTAREAKEAETAAVAALADSLRQRGRISGWHFGKHGEKGEAYDGEEDRYGRNGWKVAQDYFNQGSETALELLRLKMTSSLENPLWAKGRGNPWEGGDRNPWKQREKDPLLYHWSRHVHLFSNQLGFDIDEEVQLCSKQAKRYRRISKEFGMKW